MNIIKHKIASLSRALYALFTTEVTGISFIYSIFLQCIFYQNYYYNKFKIKLQLINKVSKL